MSRAGVVRTALGAGVASVAAAFTGASMAVVAIVVIFVTTVLVLLLIAAAVFSARDEPMHRLLRLVRALRGDPARRGPGERTNAVSRVRA